MSTAIATGNNSPTASLQITSPGIYIITFQVIGTGTGVFGNYFVAGGIPLSGAIVQSTGGASPNQYYSSGTIVYSIGASTYNLTSSFNTGILSVTSGSFTFCRIA